MYYRAEVRSVARLSPNLVRVRFGGGDLAGFSSTGVADERLVLVFPPPGQVEPPAPQEGADGTRDYPDEATRPPMRSYTVRAWDASAYELVVDFVVHAGGVAAHWALAASPGGAVYLSDARGWYAPPEDTRWQVLVADLTGLPAVGRIVEQLPRGVRAYAIVEVIAPEDRQAIQTRADVTWRWLVGTGHGLGPSGLLAAVQEFAWPKGPGYLWFAGEAAESRAVRQHLRKNLGWSPARYLSLGYWRHRQEEWMARYDRVGPELEQIYVRAVAAGQSSTDALELYDDALQQSGL